MTANTCFIFHFLPKIVAEPYIDYSSPYTPDFTVEDLLDLPKRLQQAYDESPYGKDYPYDISCLTIRKSVDLDETFQIIDFAPREVDDNAYAVKGVVHTVFNEYSYYYTVEERAESPGRYFLCHPEIGRHSFMSLSWEHIPTDEELIEVVSTLGLDFDNLASHINMLEANYKEASKSFREFRERRKLAETTDEDDLLVGCAEHGAFSALEMLDYEISRKQSFLQKKLQECRKS